MKFNFWNFFLGLVIGFAAGIILINALVPNATELIRLYGLDKVNNGGVKVIQQDK